MRSVERGGEVPLIVQSLVGGLKEISRLRELSHVQLLVEVLEIIASTVITVYVVFALIGVWKAIKGVYAALH